MQKVSKDDFNLQSHSHQLHTLEKAYVEIASDDDTKVAQQLNKLFGEADILDDNEQLPDI